MPFKDITFIKTEFNNTYNVEGTEAIKIAIRNILLSQEGNIYSIPELNIDIRKIIFETIDDSYLSLLRDNLYSEILKYIPTLEGLAIDITKIDLTGKITHDAKYGLGISIYSKRLENEYTILIYSREGIIQVI